MQLTYTIDELAVLFRRSVSTLRPVLDTLERQHNFPPRLPVFENLWSRPAVDRWFEMSGQASPSSAATYEALQQRYGEG